MINWITEQLGTASFYRLPATHNHSIIDVRELVDGAGNTNLLAAKVTAAQTALAQQHTVVICCDQGLSRSNAIAIGVLMASGQDYASAFAQVMQALDNPPIELSLLHEIRALYSTTTTPKQHPKRLLVTGASGFVGSAVMQGLAQEYEVIALPRETLDLSQDTQQLDAYVNAQGIDFILHLAHPKLRSGVTAMATAIAMLRNVLEVCKHNGLGMLYLSNMAVFSGHTGPKPLYANANSRLCPQDTYGQSKALCEQLLGYYRDLHQVNAVLLRPTAIYGPGMPHDVFLRKFIEWAKHGQTIHTHQYHNGAPQLDMLYIDDLVDAIRLAIQQQPRAALSIGSGSGHNTYEIAEQVIAAMGSSSTLEPISINRATHTVFADPQPALHQLGWQAQTPLTRGLQQLINWCHHV